jgi:site-specific recombinase XerD
MMARRVPLPVLQRLMGHADVKTTLRYVIISEGDKRHAIESVFGVAAPWEPHGSETEVNQGTSL